MGAAFLPAREGEQWGLVREDAERVRFAFGARCGEEHSMGADWRDSQIRYLVHFDDGGRSMRYRSEPLTVSAELTNDGRGYRVERVEPPPNPNVVRARLGDAARWFVTHARDIGGAPAEYEGHHRAADVTDCRACCASCSGAIDGARSHSSWRPDGTEGFGAR
jgi:hypothetical protein